MSCLQSIAECRVPRTPTCGLLGVEGGPARAMGPRPSSLRLSTPPPISNPYHQYQDDRPAEACFGGVQNHVPFSWHRGCPWATHSFNLIMAGRGLGDGEGGSSFLLLPQAAKLPRPYPVPAWLGVTECSSAPHPPISLPVPHCFLPSSELGTGLGTSDCSSLPVGG